MNFTYQLIDGGFDIFPEGGTKPIIHQPFNPQTGEPFEPELQEKVQKFVCQKLSAGLDGGITIDDYEQLKNHDETVEPIDTFIQNRVSNIIQQLEEQRQNSPEKLTPEILDTLDVLMQEILKDKGIITQ